MENIKIESETRYKWYQFKRINERYCILNECTNKYVDLNDYIYSDYYESDIKPEEKEDREIIEENKLISFNDDLFDQIILTNFSDGFYISEIKIFMNNNTSISFEISKESIFEDINILTDKNGINAYPTTSQTNLIINLLYPNDKNYFYMDLYYADFIENQHTYKMILMRNNHIIGEKTYNFNTSGIGNYYRRICSYKKENWINYTEYEKVIYKYRDKLYKYYDLEKEYAKGYYTYLKNYIKDETQSKKFYRYKLINNENNLEEKVIEGTKKEKVSFLIKNEKNKNKINIKKIVYINLILSFLFVISKILYKKIIKRRMK